MSGVSERRSLFSPDRQTDTHTHTHRQAQLLCPHVIITSHNRPGLAGFSL